MPSPLRDPVSPWLDLDYHKKGTWFRRLRRWLPWATLFVNVTGSFIIGLYGTLSGPEGRIFAGARQRQFIMTGFCGGYTTFSAFSLETFMLFRTGLSWTGWAYIAVSVACWLLAVWLGHMLATRLNRLKGS